MKLNFRQAFVISLTLHLLLVPGIGWLAGSWIKSEPATQMIEIELSAGGPGPIMTGGAAGDQIAKAPAPTSATPTGAVEPEPLYPEPIDPSEPIDTAVAEPVTSTVSKIVRQAQAYQGSGQGSFSGGSGSALTGGGVPGGEGTGAGTGSGKMQSVILPPRVLKRIEPQYPATARHANQEGIVGLRIEILANGLPGSISVVSSSGYWELDEAAETAVRKWRFVPARDSQTGSPVASTTTLSVAFRLR